MMVIKRGEVIIPSEHKNSSMNESDSMVDMDGEESVNYITAEEITEMNNRQKRFTADMNENVLEASFYGFKDLQ